MKIIPFAAHVDPLDNTFHSSLLKVLPKFMRKRKQNSAQNLINYRDLNGKWHTHHKPPPFTFTFTRLRHFVIRSMFKFLYVPRHMEPIGSSCELSYKDYHLKHHLIDTCTP